VVALDLEDPFTMNSRLFESHSQSISYTRLSCAATKRFVYDSLICEPKPSDVTFDRQCLQKVLQGVPDGKQVLLKRRMDFGFYSQLGST
jgi:hypothetical protein